MESHNWINYLAMNSIKLLGDREWDYLARISNRLEELGWINDFCLRKGIDECGEEAETKYDDEDMAWLGISTDIIIFSESVVWNIHRYPSHSATALSVTIRKDSAPDEKAKCREEGEAMNDLISVSSTNHSFPWFDEKSNKAKVSSRVCFDFIWKRARVASYSREKLSSRRRWHKSYEVQALWRCSIETLHQWKNEVNETKSVDGMASLWHLGVTLMKWQGGVQNIDKFWVFLTAVKESLGSDSKFVSKADTLNNRPRFTPCRLPLSWIEINFKRVSESSVRVI